MCDDVCVIDMMERFLIFHMILYLDAIETY